MSRLTYPRAILRDETVFSEPGEFKPSRFLKDGQIDPRLKDYFMTAFGFGRRYDHLISMLRTTLIRITGFVRVDILRWIIFG